MTEIVAVLGLLISFASATIAGIALQQSRIQDEKQRVLQERLDNEARLFESRRFFTLALWDKIAALNDIDPRAPIGPDVRNAVNVMEAVSLCWRAGIVDKQMVLMAFGSVFEDLFQKIDRIDIVPERQDGSGRSGRELLASARVIGVVREEIARLLDQAHVPEFDVGGGR